ncbi:hypothetical protein HDZ31DRAFT_66848 [Schizophyllum fasciatum]
MNVVKEINRINERELELGLSGASWHDEYKDSAYIFVGGLNRELTEGDVITIFSQYGEVMDVNMPREKETGKPKGFAFLMYEDQRSTVLAVDNLNGSTVAERTLRVDHVKNYKQKRTKNEEGEWVEPEEQSLNAKPEMIMEDAESSSDESDAPKIDPEDPMYDYLMSKYREEKAAKKDKKKKKDKHKHKDETPEERRARKERKKARKEQKAKTKSQGMQGVEDLLKSLGGGGGPRDRLGHRDGRSRSRSRSPRRTSPAHSRRSRTPPRKRSPDREYAHRRRSPSPDDGERSRKPRGEDHYRDSRRERRREYD